MSDAPPLPRRLALVSALLILATGPGCRSGGYRGAAVNGDDLPRGIPLALARERRELIEAVDYTLELTLAAGHDTFRGRCRIDVDLNEEPDALLLDFRGRTVHGVHVAGAEIEAPWSADHIVIPGSVLREGRNTIDVAYTAGIGVAGEGLIRTIDRDDGSEYLYTLNVPADGHALFPCFDQPDLKARFTLIAETPSDWNVIANAPLAQEESPTPGRTRRRFVSTERISTYLFAFAAGPFVSVVDGGGSRPMRGYGRRSQRALLEEHAPALFALHRAALGFFEDYFGIPYPFAKFEFVCVPDFPFRGMEHPGCIFYGEDTMLFRTQVTRLQEAERADLVAHETAHMWFGDLVTMPWFDDVWLKEGFATFMAHKALEATFAGVDHDRGFFLRNYPSALDTDITPGATPIRAPLGNMIDAKSNYGPIIYRKGPAVLRQLEYLLGADAFQRGTRTFLERHAFGCGAWPDLRDAMEDAGDGRDLGDWSRAWIEGAGAPRVTARIIGQAPDRTRVELTQESLSGDGRTWPVSCEVGLHGPGPHTSRAVELDETRTELDLPGGGPAFVFANQGCRAYAWFTLDPASRTRVLEDFAAIDDDLLRCQLWEALWAAVLDGELDPGRYVELAEARLFREDDQRLIRTVLDNVALALGRFLPHRRDAWARRIEQLLESTVFDPTHDRNIRLLAFRALFDVVRSEAGRDLLVAFTDGTRVPPGITVATRDRWAMVQRLVALKDARAEPRVERLRAEDAGDEGRRRAFLVACARPDLAVKRELFRRFRHDPELPERWVQNGAPIFFAGDEDASTAEFLPEALAQLDWLKENRKIFFLAAWIDACVRSRTRPEDAALVRAYADAPTTQPDVRMKVLVALDHLERTIGIRQRFGADG